MSLPSWRCSRSSPTATRCTSESLAATPKDVVVDLAAHSLGVSLALQAFVESDLTYQNVHAPYVDPPAWECRDFPGFWDKTFGNMLWQLDSGVGNVTDALKTTGLWDTTLLL